MNDLDLFDQVFEGFGEDREEAPEEPQDEFYPGSKRKRGPASAPVEFHADPWRENFTTKMVNGQETPMYPIGALATALGVSSSTVLSWTRKGYIPQAPYRLPPNMVVNGEKVSGRRLYTAPLIEAVVAAFQNHGVLGAARIEWKNHTDLSIEIRESWSRITAKRSN